LFSDPLITEVQILVILKEEETATRNPLSIVVIYLLYLITYLLHGAESFSRSQLVLSWSRNSPHFMETEGSLLHSQDPATCPYPEPDRSSPCPHPTS